MNLTPIVVTVPFLLFSLRPSIHETSNAIRIGFVALWILSLVLNLGWGVYVSHRSRLQGYLCVAVALMQIVVLLMPIHGPAR